MSKIAVVYWSGTGNTEAMAQAVVSGAKEKGAEAVMFKNVIVIQSLYGTAFNSIPLDD